MSTAQILLSIFTVVGYAIGRLHAWMSSPITKDVAKVLADVAQQLKTIQGHQKLQQLAQGAAAVAQTLPKIDSALYPTGGSSTPPPLPATPPPLPAAAPAPAVAAPAPMATPPTWPAPIIAMPWQQQQTPPEFASALKDIATLKETLGKLSGTIPVTIDPKTLPKVA